MRSNSTRGALTFLVMFVGLWLIASQRARLAGEHHEIEAKGDIYLLPSAEQVKLASLGYRSALADLIFGHVLVSYGLHFQERRLFEYVGDYLETISLLDPKFRDPYRYADTLLTLQPVAPPPEFYRRARRIQERGLKELPYDQELWSTAGQFITYLAPGQLTDREEQWEYQRTGTRYLMRACELVGANDAIPYHCITAANLLNRDGNREAVRQFLERVLTVTDDPGILQLASGYLQKVVGAREQELLAARQARFQQKWRADLAFASRTEIHALGPSFDSAACSGLERSEAPECASSWRRWFAVSEAATAP